jgi:hypothetical protein
MSLRKLCTLSVAIYLCLVFVFDFSNRHAIGLMFLVGATAWVHHAHSKASRFTPYRLIFYPQIFNMLQAIGFSLSAEDYRMLAGDVPPIDPWSPTHIFHYGLTAVVVSYDHASGTQVIHWTYSGGYSTSFERGERLGGPTVGLARAEWQPEFFIKPSGDGYRFGIRVLDGWWKQTKPKLIDSSAILHEEPEWNFGRVKLTLAVLPLELTRQFFLSDYPKKEQDVLKAKFSSHHWETDRLGNAEIGYFGEEFRHKYMRVWAQVL